MIRDKGFIALSLISYITAPQKAESARLFGAAAAAFGAYVTGNLSGWTSSRDALAYRNRLAAGKYLLIAQGPDGFIREATQVLRRYEPENLQGYVAHS